MASTSVFPVRQTADRAVRLLTIAVLATAGAPAAASTFDCLLEPAQTVDLRSPAMGTIERIHVRRGDKIRKGQVLVTLESSAEQAASQIAAHKATMTGPLSVARTKLEYSRRAYERRSQMHSENLLSGQEKDDAEGEFKAAEAELVLAQENQRLAELEAREQGSLLERRTLRSPFDGVVANQRLFVGEVVEPGDSREPILTLAQLDPLQVHVILPRTAFGKVKPGMQATIQPELAALGPLTGAVRIVDSLIDGASGTFAVFVEVPNPKLETPAGMRCRASFPVQVETAP